MIGAGPTGALAARQLALRGLRTLLVDRSSFPREKVCGGCISGFGRRILEDVGLAQLLDPSVAAPLDRFELAAGGRRVTFATASRCCGLPISFRRSSSCSMLFVPALDLSRELRRLSAASRRRVAFAQCCCSTRIVPSGPERAW